MQYQNATVLSFLCVLFICSNLIEIDNIAFSPFLSFYFFYISFLVGVTRFERAISSSQVTRINQVFPHTDMEQVKGIKPPSSTWQADILSLNYTHMEPVVSAALTPSVWKTEILVCYTIPTIYL